ncbi:hypothetical protein [Mycobacterium servetii]|uniref:Uncharacterized protein n=1 Tax=Mycobacterium servetii TaxID=3237418 RepID=A0ABV4C4V2_9MYCO
MTTTPPISVDILNVAASPDATEIHDWLQRGAGLPTRAFDGAVREAVGFMDDLTDAGSVVTTATEHGRMYRLKPE